jgi:hypothetical protein
MSDQQATGTSDPTYNVSPWCTTPSKGRRPSRSTSTTRAPTRAAPVFQQVQQGYRRTADMGKGQLVQRIEHEH